MAETATIYHFTIDLADMDRGVYETVDLKVARHPSETLEFMAVRVLAYCLEYEDGIGFTDGGLSATDEPAIATRDLTGQITAWIDVGLPDAARLHRASKAAGRVVVYPHRDTRQWLAQLSGTRIHRAAEIPVRACGREGLAEFVSCLDRRNAVSVSVTHGELFLAVGDRTITIPIEERRLPT